MSQRAQAETTTPAGAQARAAGTRRPGAPRHFHLLWEEELEELRPVLARVRERLEEVIDHWYTLYMLHFGDERSLGQQEFRAIFQGGLDRDLGYLLAGDMDSYAAATIRVGEALAEHHVPFSEVIALLHLLEEAAYRVFPASPPPPLEIYTTFDKLSHVRMILLADAYFRTRAATADVRVTELEVEAGRLAHGERTRFHGLVGATPAMRRLYQQIEAVAHTRGNLLVVGESGTGKELVARAIHECGPAPERPFVALNCAAIPRDLIESELFGYKRGAFSGANADYLGLFRAAEGGTLFLDEVTEMSPATQSKLLRALQERSVRPVGSTREVGVDARLIASTNRDPEEAMRTGLLRDDLYYRLQASVLRVPPLRERAADIPLLVDHFITLFNEKLKPRIPVSGIEAEALEAMTRHAWPGNVRELSNAIESAVTFGSSGIIPLEDLPSVISGSRRPAQGGGQAGPVTSFADAERELVARALEATRGNKVAAAKLLRISRKKLYAKIAKYGLD